MKVKCVKNILQNIEPLVLYKLEKARNENDENDEYYVCSLDYYSIDQSTNGYALRKNSLYDVYGIMFFQSIFRYLVFVPDFSAPQWFPSELFTVVDNRIPYNWHFREFTSNSETGKILGYKELALNYSHLVGLMAQNANDIKVFLNAKKDTEYFT